MRLLTTIIISSILLTSCSEIRTEDPIKSYEYWAGTKPPRELKVIQAKYWQSAHWTKEYILYLKLKPTEEWWSELLKQNNLVKDTGQWTIPSDSPEWFKLPNNVTSHRPGDNFCQSRFFRDNQTGECYIYDIQL